MNLDSIPYSQDAEKGHMYLVAVVDPQTGRQIVNMNPDAVPSKMIELRNAGFGWHDKDFYKWTRTGDRWHRTSEESR